jgi:TrmH family RNA methyltransferase
MFSKRPGMITSAHNPRIQLVRRLTGRARERRQENAFVAEGVRLVEEAYLTGWPFRFCLYDEGLSDRGRTLVQNLLARGISCEEAAPGLLQKISETESSQGLLAVLDLVLLPVLAGLSFALVFDSIRDPGNLGTLLRTAAAAGAQAVFLPPETTDAFAPKVLRAGMGAHFHLPLQTLAWAEIQAGLKGLHIFLADTGGPLSCWQADFKSPLALIVGGEAEGASEPACRLADQLISIPMPGKAESLNAAMAGAILMFEVVRQRQER